MQRCFLQYFAKDINNSHQKPYNKYLSVFYIFLGIIKMNKMNPAAVLIGILSLCATSAMANPAEQLQKAVKTGGQASGNAAASAGHSLVATGQLASGVVATPLLTSGAISVGVGSAALQAGGSLMNAATHPIGSPLPVTEETVSIIPPNKALQQPAAKN
jgi:hypothetical protein